MKKQNKIFKTKNDEIIVIDQILYISPYGGEYFSVHFANGMPIYITKEDREQVLEMLMEEK